MNLYDILMKDNVVEVINNRLEYLKGIIPEITFMFGFDQKHPHHSMDVWEHTLYALNLSEKDFEVRLTLLLHDIGKPFSYVDDNAIRHFPGHAEVSAEMTKKILQRLGYDENFVGRICYLVKMHDTPITSDDIAKDYEMTYKRFLAQRCDALAHNPKYLEGRKMYIAKIKKLLTPAGN